MGAPREVKGLRSHGTQQADAELVDLFVYDTRAQTGRQNRVRLFLSVNW